MAYKIFTTFHIARICGVSPSTVIHWINRGKLPAFRTPGGHRRVPASDLLNFLKRYGMPIPESLVGEEEKKRVLIVDDEPQIAGMLRRAFAKASPRFEPRAVTDGVEALVLVGTWRPDLVVLDAVMPVVDGMRVCASLKADPQTRRIRIIAITGKKLSDSQRRFLQANTDAYFTKPFDLLELVRTAAGLLAVPEAIRPGKSA